MKIRWIAMIVVGVALMAPNAGEAQKGQGGPDKQARRAACKVEAKRVFRRGGDREQRKAWQRTYRKDCMRRGRA
jgi:hypothetical protein